MRYASTVLGLRQHHFGLRSVAIIPLGPESLRDSSSLPEGRDASLLRAMHVRAGPALPSYLALLHAGFSVPPASLPGRWALTPPFHPCQMNSTMDDRFSVSRGTGHRVRITGGLFSVALSVAASRRTHDVRTAARDPLALPGALPFSLRRKPKSFPCDSGPRVSESGLSSRPPL